MAVDLFQDPLNVRLDGATLALVSAKHGRLTPSQKPAVPLRRKNPTDRVSKILTRLRGVSDQDLSPQAYNSTFVTGVLHGRPTTTRNAKKCVIPGASLNQ
jgi:hypothetical protein